MIDKYTMSERNLLFYILHYKQVALKCKQQQVIFFIEDYDKIYKFAIEYYKKHEYIDIVKFAKTINDKELSNKVMYIYNQCLPRENNHLAIFDYIHILNIIKKENLTEKFNKEKNPEEKAKIFKEILDLDKLL